MSGESDLRFHPPLPRVSHPETAVPRHLCHTPAVVWNSDPEPRWLARLKLAAVVLVPLFIVGLAVC